MPSVTLQQHYKLNLFKFLKHFDFYLLQIFIYQELNFLHYGYLVSCYNILPKNSQNAFVFAFKFLKNGSARAH